MQLTEHFTYEELDVVGAEPRIVDNNKFLCEQVLEPLRAHFGAAVDIHCAYRNPKHNAAVGGKTASFHLDTAGHAAADVNVVGMGIKDAFDWLRLESHLKFDKTIMETNEAGIPACVHLQIDRLNPPRRQAFIGQTGACEHYTQVEVR
jgi:hypothetical protein